MKSLKGSETERNILTAFAGESQARNRYTYFQSKAKARLRADRLFRRDRRPGEETPSALQAPGGGSEHLRRLPAGSSAPPWTT
jgi:hypothetical protein